MQLEHPKMDRGMVCIEGLQLVDWVHAFFASKSPLHVNVLALLQTLFRLEMTWYAGAAGTSDTLLSCVLMHRNPGALAQRLGDGESAVLAVLAAEATMAVATLVAMLISTSPVVREEDFSPSIHGMNAWSPAAHHGCLDEILSRLLAAASRLQGRPERFYFIRLYSWIRALLVWRRFQMSQFLGTLEELTVLDVLGELQHVMASETDKAFSSENECSSSQAQSLAFFDQKLANLFGLGCVRPARRISSLAEAQGTWNRLLSEDLGCFLGGLLARRPRLEELLRLLAERSRRPNVPGLLPLSRALVHLSLVQTAPDRGQTSFFCHLEARDAFLATSWPGVPILALPQLVAFCTDLVQVYCSNTARQRRYLSRLLPVYAQFLESEAVRCCVTSGTRARSQLLALNTCLQADWILLGFELGLYSAIEEEEADCWLAAVLDLNTGAQSQDREQVREQEQEQREDQAKRIRWQHRWAPLLHSITSLPTADRIKQATAFRRFLRDNSLTGHSVNQLHEHL
jgi:hypothetical protein